MLCNDNNSIELISFNYCYWYFVYIFLPLTGYLHDKRYVQTGGGASTSNSYEGIRNSTLNLATIFLISIFIISLGLNDEIHKWKNLTIGTLTLLILLIILICVYETCKWKKFNNITISSLRDKFFKKVSLPHCCLFICYYWIKCKYRFYNFSFNYVNRNLLNLNMHFEFIIIIVQSV